MIVELKYNDIIINLNLDVSKKIGSIQENILNLCTLIIYNIEYTEIIFKNNPYILGNDDMQFNEILNNFMIKNNYEESDIDKIIVYDRKRDSMGNVIKKNYIIDKYNEWYINNENNNYSSHIIRLPIERILQNILRIPSINYDQQIENTEENTEQNTEENAEENTEQIIAQRTTENLNNIINIFDRIISNNLTESSYQIFSLNNELDDLPELIENNIFNYININNTYEDIKIVLEDEIFEKLNHQIYNNFDSELKECLICIDCLEENNEITHLHCNHIFHKKCIKTWLCEESNKCPICRIDIDKGIPK